LSVTYSGLGLLRITLMFVNNVIIVIIINVIITNLTEDNRKIFRSVMSYRK